MIRKSHNSFPSIKSAIQPFMWAMLLIIGFHFIHISNFHLDKHESAFYEIGNTKVSTPCLSLENHHLADQATFGAEEKEEKSESETNFGIALNNTNTLYVVGFFHISGAANKSLKIPSIEGKSPLYILFHSLRVHLA